MKPTVITNNGGSGGNGNTGPAPNTPSAGQQNPQNANGFGFEPDMDDMFSDAGIRSRLGRMPFGFGSRKRINDPNRYFDDDNDFFSNFGSLGRRRQSQPQSDRTGIFDHIPQEFRQYMPDSFDFPSTVRNTPPSPRSAGVQPQYPPQYHETYAQTGQGSPTTNQPQAQKPKLCDAAIQTENPPDDGTDPANKTHRVQPLKQHGMRNTVDLGHKSPPENEQFSRAQSAPPNDASEQNFEPSTASTSSQTSNPSNNYTSSTAYAYVPPPEQQRYHAAQQTSPPHPQQRPPAPHPPPRSNPQQQYYQQPTQPQPQQSNSQGGAYVRTVPIFVEGRSEPVINEQKYTPPESQPSNQYQQQHSPPHFRSHKEFRPQQPQPQPQPQEPQYQQPQFQQPQQQHHQEQYQPYQQHQQNQQYSQPEEHSPQHRPTPLNTQQANAAPVQHSPVPSTPQTTATIEKIQLIQRDVLNLMSKVEKFGGFKNDKEYMYLDEMLTRNLLKLDTIDTQGKERIRLARKEAIKCIQASINVLEAKAEENAKTAKKSVMNDSQEISTNTEQLEQQNTTNDENSNINSVPAALDEASTAKLPDVVPLPPPPERPSKDNKKSNDNEKCLEQINNQEIKDQNAEQIKNEKATKIDEKQETEQTLNETNQENKTINIEQKNDKSIAPSSNVSDPVPIAADETTISPDEQIKKDEKQKSPTKEERSKESPKKKIIKRIIKKLDKKDKKGSSVTPPSTEQQETSSEALPAPVTEVTN